MGLLRKGLKKQFEALDKALINSYELPFASTTYDKTKPIKFFIGRETEIKKILQVLQHVLGEAQSKGIALEGPGGCGKSTLFGFINEIVHQGRIMDFPGFLLDTRIFSVFSTYITAPENADTFRKLWPSIFEGLEEADYSFFELISYQFLAKLFQVFQGNPEKLSEYSKIIWGDEKRIPSFMKTSGYRKVSWQEIYQEYLVGNLSERIPKIIDFIKKNARKIVYNFTIPAGDHPALPSQIKLDHVQTLSRLEKFLSVLGEDMSLLDSFYCRDDGTITDDDQAFGWFNFLTNLYMWISGKIPCFLIGVDDIGKVTGGETQRRIFYEGFFNTLIRMRNKLRFVVFVLIGTTDDWQKMNAFIEANTDLYSQVQGFLIEKISLDHLEQELATQVYKNRVEEFWNKQAVQPRDMRWYPFSDSLFSYIHYYTGHQLRESLNVLNRIWQEFRLSQNVTMIENYLSAMRVVRTIEKDWPSKFLVNSFHEFERNCLVNEFWDPRTYRTDGERSRVCEEAMTLGFELLAKKDSPRYVDRAQCNPTFTITIDGKKQKRRPDVYVEFFGQLGPKRARRVEFQVKIYSKNSFVSHKELKSSFQLIEVGFTDLLYLIMTGRGLDPNAMNQAQNFENRIMGLQPLNEDQILALILLARYKEITGANLSPAVVKALLEQILNQQWEDFIADLKMLPKNYGLERIRKPEIIIEDYIEKPLIDEVMPEIKEEIPVEDHIITTEPIIESVKTEQEVDIEDRVVISDKPIEVTTWIDKFPSSFSDFQKEIKYLFNLVLTRKGRWEGQTSLNFLIKNPPSDISRNKLKRLFKELPKETRYFKKEKTSIHITEEGNVIASSLG